MKRVLMMASLLVLLTACGEVQFMSDWKSGEVTMEGNLIELGQMGNPAYVGDPPGVPYDSKRTTLLDYPMKFRIVDCVALTLPADAIGVMAATNFSETMKISIAVPQKPSGSVNVCVPEGATIEVFLWAFIESEQEPPRIDW